MDYLALGLLPVVEDAMAYRLDAAAERVAVHATDWFAALRVLFDDPEAARARIDRRQSWLWEKRGVSAIAETMVARLEALR